MSTPHAPLARPSWIASATATAALAAGCASLSEPPAELAERVAAAHGHAFYAAPAVHADVRVEFGGATLLDGRMTYEPSSGRSRFDLEGGTVAVFDGERAWVAPAESGLPSARFHLLTWPYFLAAPWKLGDPGTRLEWLEPMEIDGVRHDAARLTFEGSVGDTPDDWYVVHVDPRTHELRALAYIVTYGTSLDEAEAEPHVALYEEYRRVDGLQVPARIGFANWSREEGPVGQPLGVATFADVRFAPAAPGAFERPPGAREDPLP